jgi:hypothetical protein
MLFVHKAQILLIARAISAKLHGKAGFAQKKENKLTKKCRTKEGKKVTK